MNKLQLTHSQSHLASKQERTKAYEEGYSHGWWHQPYPSEKEADKDYRKGYNDGWNHYSMDAN